MKKISRILAAALAAITLAGCSADGSKDEESSPAVATYPEETSEAAAETTAAKPAEEPTTEAPEPGVEQRELPTLSIKTNNGSFDFYTEPVARHVAEAIASWTPGYAIPPEPYYENCSVSLLNSEGSDFESAEALVKVRGNWTTVYGKKPLRIKFSEKRNLLGLNDGAKAKNWLLLAEYKDASMLRNKTALSIAREILGEDGLYCADAEFVSVEINDEYIGTYLLTEMQQVGKHRVNVAEPEKDYKGMDIGYFLEYDGYFTDEDELHGFALDFADNAELRAYDGVASSNRTRRPLPENDYDPTKPVGATIKSDIYSAEQRDFIANFVNKTYRIMYEAAYNDKAFVFDKDYKNISETDSITPREAVEKVVNVQSLADMYIISELTCDADIYWSSFFMAADFSAEGDKRLTFEAPWDFDSAMGNKDRCIDGKGYYASNIVPDVNGGLYGGGEYDTLNPWLVVLAYEDWYRDVVKATWKRAAEDGVFERAYKLIEEDSSQLRSEFERNYGLWDNIRHNEEFANELSKPAAKCRTEAEAAEFLLKWLKSRVDFLDGEFGG